MQYFPQNLFYTVQSLVEMPSRLLVPHFTGVAKWHIVIAVAAVNLILATLANAQISPDLPNPTTHQIR